MLYAFTLQVQSKKKKNPISLIAWELIFQLVIPQSYGNIKLHGQLVHIKNS